MTDFANSLAEAKAGLLGACQDKFELSATLNSLWYREPESESASDTESRISQRSSD
jgi:hypothetical protein